MIIYERDRQRIADFLMSIDINSGIRLDSNVIKSIPLFVRGYSWPNLSFYNNDEPPYIKLDNADIIEIYENLPDAKSRVNFKNRIKSAGEVSSLYYSSKMEDLRYQQESLSQRLAVAKNKKEEYELLEKKIERARLECEAEKGITQLPPIWDAVSRIPILRKLVPRELRSEIRENIMENLDKQSRHSDLLHERILLVQNMEDPDILQENIHANEKMLKIGQNFIDEILNTEQIIDFPEIIEEVSSEINSETASEYLGEISKGMDRESYGDLVNGGLH